MAEVSADTDPVKKGSKEFSDLETYGDLKRVIKSIITKKKVGTIVGSGKSKVTDIALDAAVEAVKSILPGAGLAKHAFDILRGAIKKPDTEKTGTWLDKLDLDDEMTDIIDDTVENGFIQAMTDIIQKEPDDKPLEQDFNMNAKMVNYLKDKYEGRHVSGIQERKRLQKLAGIK